MLRDSFDELAMFDGVCNGAIGSTINQVYSIVVGLIPSIDH